MHRHVINNGRANKSVGKAATIPIAFFFLSQQTTRTKTRSLVYIACDYAAPFKIWRCAIPQAPRSKSCTRRYLRLASHPKTSQTAGGRGLGGSFTGNPPLPFISSLASTPSASDAETGTVDKISLGIPTRNPALFDTHRQTGPGMVGPGPLWSVELGAPPKTASLSASSPECGDRGVGTTLELSSVERFARERDDCFFSRRLIVSV